MTQTLEVLSFEEIKKMCPDEWVVLGNPVYDGFKVVSGILILHGKDKRELAYAGRELVKKFESFAFRFTGETPKNRKFLL